MPARVRLDQEWVWGVPEASEMVMVKMPVSQEAFWVERGDTPEPGATGTWRLPLERMRTLEDWMPWSEGAIDEMRLWVD